MRYGGTEVSITVLCSHQIILFGNNKGTSMWATYLRSAHEKGVSGIRTASPPPHWGRITAIWPLPNYTAW